MIKKYPFVKQSNLKDCGVSCLQMIIKFYKGYVSTSYLQILTKTTKKGTSAYHIVEAAKKLGFESYGVKANLKDLNQENMILPCIVNVTIDNTYNHYLVIYEINYKTKQILVADPAKEKYRISFEKFDKIWNNIIIFLYPISKIACYSKEKYLNKLIYNVILNNKKLIIKIILYSIFYSILSIICSYSLKIFINSYANNLLTFNFIIFLLFNIIKLINDYTRNYLLNFLNEKIEISLNKDIFKNIISLPYNYYKNHTTGEIVSRINDLDKIRDFISKAIILLIDIPLSIISIFILFYLNNTLFFISISSIIFYSLINLLFLSSFQKFIEDTHTTRSNYTSYMIESINNYESIKGISMEENVIIKFESKFLNFIKNIFKFNSLYNLEKFLKEFIYEISTLIIIYVGCLSIIKGKFSVGNLLVFSSLFNYLIFPIKNLMEYLIIYKGTKNSVKRINEIIFKEEEHGIIENRKINNIEFKKFCYSYNDIDYVLKNINLKINKGEKVMIIGSSGSGKSTLLKMILKYHEVKRNTLFIDDVDINDYKTSVIRNNINYISQNENLFNDSIKNNIDYDKKLTNDEFLNICKLCFVDEIILNNNLGYNMLIEENGFNISGGQKQRIILARSLTKEFEILLIDEGLNQMDIGLERKILKNLFNKYSDKTIIIISHRLDNLDLFDRLIKMSKNKIIEDVTKNEFRKI